jgi:hypothetical protein
MSVKHTLCAVAFGLGAIVFYTAKHAKLNGETNLTELVKALDVEARRSKEWHEMRRAYAKDHSITYKVRHAKEMAYLRKYIDDRLVDTVPRPLKGWYAEHMDKHYSVKSIYTC